MNTRRYRLFEKFEEIDGILREVENVFGERAGENDLGKVMVTLPGVG